MQIEEGVRSGGQAHQPDYCCLCCLAGLHQAGEQASAWWLFALQASLSLFCGLHLQGPRRLSCLQRHTWQHLAQPLSSKHSASSFERLPPLVSTVFLCFLSSCPCFPRCQGTGAAGQSLWFPQISGCHSLCASFPYSLIPYPGSKSILRPVVVAGSRGAHWFPN